MSVRKNIASRPGQRLVDLALAIPALILTLPLFVIISITIRLDSPGPAIFRQERVGRGGRHFRILKFRTMNHNLTKGAVRTGSLLTIGADERITRVGAWLRRLKLDELPQLINIVRGEMSLVGARPEVPRYVARYSEDERRILAYRPGLTSPASIEFRDESDLLAEQADPEGYYCTVQIPAKIAIDLAYLDRASTLSDLSLLAQTVLRVVVR
ncbi:MAG: sugar transferase [Acidobacteriota bacterium]